MMPLTTTHRASMRSLAMAARRGTLALIATRCPLGVMRPVVCMFTQDEVGQEFYLPLAFLTDEAAAPLLRSLEWPKLAAPVVMPSVEPTGGRDA